MLKTSRSLAITLLLSLTPVVLPHAALAQGPADPTLQAAHARFEEGVKFFDKGQFENARASFLQAYALRKHPAVLINLAESSLRSGHALDAARYFTQYMRDSPSLTAAQRAEAEKGLAEARTKLGRIDVTAPAGMTIMIDAELAGTDGSTRMDVEPGAHAVKGGGETQSVTVAAGQSVTVRLGRQGGGAAAVVPPVPVEPAAPAPAAPSVTPPPPETPAAPAAPPPSETQSGPGFFSPPAMMTPVWVGGTVTVVGFATAILFGVFKGSALNSYNSEVAAIKSAVPNSSGACVNPAPSSPLAAPCASLSSDSSSVNTDATLANVGLAVGIVGVAFTAGWYFLAPKEAAAAPKAAWVPRVDPMVGPKLQGLTLTSSF